MRAQEGDRIGDCKPFAGFAPPISNTTYTPNQFFDVAIAHATRTGVIRVVTYILRKQLGWCDEQGNPQNTQVAASYLQLERKAGVGHSQIRESLDAAMDGGFIQCVEEGASDARGQPGGAAVYALRWDLVSPYRADPRAFSGFFGREGNRTFIPNQFFDQVIPSESLGVIKVVAAIIRNTIGWRNQFGFQRRQVQMSVTELQRRTRLSRRALRLALNRACERNYVERVDRGFFDPCAGRESRAAVYRLKWADQWVESRRADAEPPPCPTPESTTAVHTEFDHGNSPNHSQKNHGANAESTTGNRSSKYHAMKRTSKKKTSEKKTTRPGSAEVPVVVDDFDQAFDGLVDQGFTKRDAARLAALQSLEVIHNQLQWLPLRNAAKNRLGLLRRAIEENWAPPILREEIPVSPSPGETFARHYYAGYHGNAGSPTAQPFGRDAAAADRFVAHLLSVHQDEKRIPEWGSRFGSFVRTKHQNDSSAKPFLSTALTLYGDEFYLSVRSEQARSLKTVLKEERKQHLQKHRDKYNAYLVERAKSLEAFAPENYRGFQESWKRKRVAGEDAEPKTKAFWDHFVRRGRAPRKFPILGFWEWDRQLNTEPFEAGESAA